MKIVEYLLYAVIYEHIKEWNILTGILNFSSFDREAETMLSSDSKLFLGASPPETVQQH